MNDEDIVVIPDLKNYTFDWSKCKISKELLEVMKKKFKNEEQGEQE